MGKNIVPHLKEANTLLLNGILALSQIESNGIHIDVEYLKNTGKVIAQKRKEILEKLDNDDVVKHWKKKFGQNFNPNSPVQLSYILFDYMGLKPIKTTATGRAAMDVNILEELADNSDVPMLHDLMELRKLEKAEGTYLKGILRETSEDGFLHPFFYLHTAVTYRSSSSSINFQNVPTRNKMVKEMIRGAFLPRKGHKILELDFKGAEVSVACCYHKDPAMKEYLCDPTKDMHRDMAKQLYILDDNEWNKAIRQAAKNKFVFPEFYGSYYEQTGPDLWKYVILNKCRIGKNQDGPDVITHLKSHGIKTLEKFVKHVKKIEDHFWYERFPVYTQWKEDWLEAYAKKGYMDTFTGFRISGPLSRNDIINYPVQGSAFHCLLWTLTQMQAWMLRRNMKSKIVGQIHDSMVIDLDPDEEEVVLRKAQHLVQIRLPQHWDWIYIPLTIEAEITGVDESWLHKKEIDISKYSYR